ncbi:MAG: hypothetical protein ABWY27_01685 [Telluria sp.]
MRRHLIVPLVFCLVGGPAGAQSTAPSRPTPEDLLRMTDASTASTLAMLERVGESQLNAQLKMAERPETAERIATFKKNLFDALRRKGFTAEESFQIMASTPIPAVSTSAR